MTFLQRLAHSDSPKLERPFRSAVGYALQKTGLSQRFAIARNGYRLPFDPSSNVALTFWTNPQMPEPSERFAQAWLQPGDTVLDVGANIGAVTAAAANVVGPAGHVHAIEAHPGTFRILQKTVALNGFTNVTCHQVAATDQTGKARISDLGRKDDNNHLVAAGDHGIAVNAIALSELFESEQIARVSLLKIDVEGHEMAVLQGLGSKARVDCIHLESLESLLVQNGQTMEGLRTWLTNAGYHLFRHEGDQTNMVAVLNPETACRRCALEPLPV